MASSSPFPPLSATDTGCDIAFAVSEEDAPLTMPPKKQRIDSNGDERVAAAPTGEILPPAERCRLDQLNQVYSAEVSVDLDEIELHPHQRQTVAFILDNERDGFQTDRLFRPYNDHELPARVFGGMVAHVMGMGKSACIVAACLKSRKPTLVVAPQLPCVQWKDQFQRFAPNLSVKMCYGSSQSNMEHELLGTDVIVVNATSVLLESIRKRVERVVVDESHLVLIRSGEHGEAKRFLHSLGEYPNVKHIWLVSGTPFGNSERMDNPLFLKQAAVLLRRPKNSFGVKAFATTDDAKALIMRMEKTQRLGGVAPVVPELEYRHLEVAFGPLERELYGIAACVDGWVHRKLDVRQKRADDVARYLSDRFALRILVLGGRIAEFKTKLFERFDKMLYNADSVPPDMFFAQVDRMIYRIEECCKALMHSSSKIDAVLAEIQSLSAGDSSFKAVVVTDSQDAGRYVSSKVGRRAGVMQRPKGRMSLREQKVLQEFQAGMYDILVCSFEAVRTGTNLEQAGAIYFVDSTFDDTEHKQACSRIARCGTKHATLTATFVYVKHTLSEGVYNYHKDRRNGKTIDEAAKRFEKDTPHDFTSPSDFYRVQEGDRFTGLRFACDRRPSPPSLTPSLTWKRNMDVDDILGKICDASYDLKEYDVSLKFLSHARPACYDMATQIVVSAKRGGAFKLVFPVPDQVTSVLHAKVRVSDVDAECLESIEDWHWSPEHRPSAVEVHVVLSTGTTMPLFDRLYVIKASCSCCRFCGWRVVCRYEVPFVGNVDATTNLKGEVLPNEKIFAVKSTCGSLCAFMNYRSKLRLGKPALFMPVTDRFRECLELARKTRHTMGVVPCNLSYKVISRKFFEARDDVYAKALVKLEDANVDDTITFQHKNRLHEVFVREMIPIGTEWYAVAYVVDESKPKDTIVIENVLPAFRTFDKRVRAEIVNTLRVVGDDAAMLTKLKAFIIRNHYDACYNGVSFVEKLKSAVLT